MVSIPKPGKAVGGMLKVADTRPVSVLNTSWTGRSLAGNEGMSGAWTGSKSCSRHSRHNQLLRSFLSDRRRSSHLVVVRIAKLTCGGQE